MKPCFLLPALACIPLCAMAAHPAENLSWEEIGARYEVPAWYREGKLGVWAHWGPQAEPEHGGGWYARHLYMQDTGREKWGSEAYSYHLNHYGHPSVAGYKEVLNSWKAARLDADSVLKYARDTLGARFFLAQANHHDHFDNFDSSHHPWNSVRVGPRRDIVGEFAAASRKAGLRFGVSSHDDRFLSWWLPAFGTDKTGPKRGVAYDGHQTLADGKGRWWEGLDPQKLYGLPPAQRTPEYVESVKRNWLERHTELVDKYRPDMVWFDGNNFPYGDYGKKFAEHFFNEALRRDGGRLEVVLGGKPQGLPPAQRRGWVRDIERGVPERIPDYAWESITTPNTWFYQQESSPRQDARTLAEIFADVLSKNGVFIINLELRGDGALPERLMPVYERFGAWVRLNREAIYATRAWKTFGDNLSGAASASGEMSEADLSRAKHKSSDFNERTLSAAPYSHDEVRFTVRGDKLFVFVLNPEPGTVKLSTLGLKSRHAPGKVTAVRHLAGGAAAFSQTDDALTLEVPASVQHGMPAVFEVSGAL